MPKSEAAAGQSVASLARTAMAYGLDAMASGDAATARRWLERAHRLVPRDPNVALALAAACLAQDPARAAALFQSIAEEHDLCEAWLGLASARLRSAGPDAAAQPLAMALSCHAFRPEMAPLAEAVTRRSGRPGWCALRSDGTPEIHAAMPGQVVVATDGNRLRGTTLPADWVRYRRIEVQVNDLPLFGSPIQVTAIRRLVGCAEATDGGIDTWAWHPNDPDSTPKLTLFHPSTGIRRGLLVDKEHRIVAASGPLAKARSFRLTREDLLATPGLVHLQGPDGKDLPGSPLDPGADAATHEAAARYLGRLYPASPAMRPHPADASFGPPSVSVPSPMLRADAPVPAQPWGEKARRHATTIVIPVHDGGPLALNCLTSVLAELPPRVRVLVVDDGSCDPDLVAALDDLKRQRRIALLRHPTPLGFPAAANAGIRAASGRDVVLLNSDTLVPPGWIPRLRQAAYAERDIGTVTPLSNEASILSYPGPAGTNPRPDLAATTRLDRAAQRANGDGRVDIPVGIGFCLYIRRDCLDAVGLLRADLFAQGYGEENDFCLRARRLGWRNVALTGLFVGHLGGTSFRGNAAHLRARNGRILERLHPGWTELIERFCARDALAEPRRRIDLVRWRTAGRGWRQSVILITHNAGGGVERRLIRAVQAHRDAGRRAIVLRPAETPAGHAAISVHEGCSDALPNLVYAVPSETTALLRLLRAARPEMIEVHHCADYPAAIYDVISQLNIPYDIHVHDYAWFCPRVSLVGAHDRYCGEPDLATCEACVTDNGHFLQEDITVAGLRRRSFQVLTAARRIVVPSDDAGIRMRRHFEALATTTVPHEDDKVIATTPVASQSKHARARLCVVGSLGVHKGYNVVLSCARDAKNRNLDMEFVIVGHTIDDARLLATGRVFITGRFKPDEAVTLIAEQNAQFGFVPSICPETWCLSLGDLWRAGLPAVAFDIGAPAERIRRTGRGILLPLSLSASAINNRLMAAISTAAQ